MTRLFHRDSTNEAIARNVNVYRAFNNSSSKLIS